MLFKKKYFDALENDQSTLYQTNRRICKYIYQNRDRIIEEEYLWEYWKQYTADWFEVMISLELGDYYNPEMLITDVPYYKQMLEEI